MFNTQNYAKILISLILLQELKRSSLNYQFQIFLLGLIICLIAFFIRRKFQIGVYLKIFLTLSILISCHQLYVDRFLPSKFDCSKEFLAKNQINLIKDNRKNIVFSADIEIVKVKKVMNDFVISQGEILTSVGQRYLHDFKYQCVPWSCLPVKKIFSDFKLECRKNSEGFNSALIIKKENYQFEVHNEENEVKLGLISNLKEKFAYSKELSILLAATLGYRSLLNKEDKEVFSKTGTMHLLVTSGYHLGVLFLLFNIAFKSIFSRYFSSSSVPVFYYSGMFALGFTFLFILFSDENLALSRAFIALCFFYLSLVIDRKFNFINVVLFTAISIILIYPYSYLSPSWQFTFAALLGLFIGLRISLLLLNSTFYENFKFANNKLVKNIVSVLILNASAFLFTAPLVYFYFGYFTPQSILINSTWGVLFSLIVIFGGYLSIIIYLIFMPIVDAIYNPGSYLISLVLRATSYLLEVLDFVSNLF